VLDHDTSSSGSCQSPSQSNTVFVCIIERLVIFKFLLIILVELLVKVLG